MKNIKYFLYLCFIIGIIMGNLAPEDIAKKYFEGVIGDILCIISGIVLLFFWVAVFVAPFYIGQYLKSSIGNWTKTILIVILCFLSWQYWTKNPKETLFRYDYTKTKDWKPITVWVRDKPFNEKFGKALFYNVFLIATTDKYFYDRFVITSLQSTFLDVSFTFLSLPFYFATVMIYSLLGSLLCFFIVLIPPYIIGIYGLLY